jgi:osmotically-inducible protein OsmY
VKGKGGLETIRDCGPDPHGIIDVSVAEGVVLLDNYVATLVQKRMAGVLAWWVPGSRDVINGLAVEPPQDDSDGEMAKAVRLALMKDRLIQSDDLRVAVKQAVVTLEGSVPAEAQKEMAEFDAWYVFGVDKVVNALEVR